MHTDKYSINIQNIVRTGNNIPVVAESKGVAPIWLTVSICAPFSISAMIMLCNVRKSLEMYDRYVDNTERVKKKINKRKAKSTEKTI